MTPERESWTGSGAGRRAAVAFGLALSDHAPAPPGSPDAPGLPPAAGEVDAGSPESPGAAGPLPAAGEVHAASPPPPGSPTGADPEVATGPVTGVLTATSAPVGAGEPCDTPPDPVLPPPGAVPMPPDTPTCVPAGRVAEASVELGDRTGTLAGTEAVAPRIEPAAHTGWIKSRPATAKTRVPPTRAAATVRPLTTRATKRDATTVKHVAQPGACTTSRAYVPPKIALMRRTTGASLRMWMSLDDWTAPT
jgi:hypothetical protein